jgi:hypothetical protein
MANGKSRLPSILYFQSSILAFIPYPRHPRNPRLNFFYLENISQKSWTRFCMTDNNDSKRLPQGGCFGRAKRGSVSGETSRNTITDPTHPIP